MAEQQAAVRLNQLVAAALGWAVPVPPKEEVEAVAEVAMTEEVEAVAEMTMTAAADWIEGIGERDLDPPLHLDPQPRPAG